jgi:hypothetical protein
MKRIMSALFYTAILLTLYPGCSKNDETNEYQNKFSFRYKGKTYKDVNNGGIIISNGFAGITIQKPDITGGYVWFYSPGNCAFQIPVQPTTFTSSGCLPDDLATMNIDPSQIYYYSSGSINYSYSACVKKRTPDAVFGGWLEYEECTVSGSFALTLKNNFNQEIVITDGSFLFQRVKID